MYQASTILKFIQLSNPMILKATCLNLSTLMLQSFQQKKQKAKKLESYLKKKKKGKTLSLLEY